MSIQRFPSRKYLLNHFRIQRCCYMAGHRRHRIAHH